MDFGNTRPSGIPNSDEMERVSRAMNIPEEKVIPFDPYSFPTTSKSIKYGKLSGNYQHGKDPYKVNPFFIVGGDKQSKAWLIRNKEYLLNNDIKRGLITNVYSADDYKTMQDAARPLKLYVLNVDQITETFGLHVYPVVITKEEVKQ